MARRRGSGAGLLLTGGMLLLVAMCRGEGARTQTEAAPTAAAPAPTQQPAPLSEPMQVTASTLNQRTAPDGAVVGQPVGRR